MPLGSQVLILLGAGLSSSLFFYRSDYKVSSGTQLRIGEVRFLDLDQDQALEDLLLYNQASRQSGRLGVAESSVSDDLSNRCISLTDWIKELSLCS